MCQDRIIASRQIKVGDFIRLETKEMGLVINLGVNYKSDLERVEKVSIEVASQVMKEVAGGVPFFEPFVRFHAFSDFSIDRYAAEGIVILYPIRAINNTQEQ